MSSAGSRSSHEPALLVRADAGSRMGTGHIMRCLALAQAWHDQGGRAVFAVAAPASPVEAHLAEERCPVERIHAEPGSPEDARETATHARRLGAEWVVLDGYHFDGAFQRRLKDAGLRLLALDDYGHAGRYAADLILNQNLHAEEGLYRNREPSTGLLLGTRYALLRREFHRWQGWRRKVPPSARKVLVTLGGADPDNVTLMVVRALRRLPADAVEAVVVVGSLNPNLPELRDSIRGTEKSIHLRDNVIDMPPLMAWADVAVAAGGSSSWERALLGLPSLILVLADNQASVAAACAREGIGSDLGRPQGHTAEGLAVILRRFLDDAGMREAMAGRGPELVDGRGAERVVELLRGGKVGLRPAQAEDCRLVWEWANDSSVRRLSFSMDPIPWEAHQAWFATRLADPACRLFVVTSGGTPVGQVRCDLEGTRAVLSICLDGRHRGRGYGPYAIRLACREVFAAGQATEVVALIRSENSASRRAFEKAGFVPDGTTTVRGWPTQRYIMEEGAAS